MALNGIAIQMLYLVSLPNAVETVKIHKIPTSLDTFCSSTDSPTRSKNGIAI